MVGLGTDIVRVERIAALLARHGERFRQRCFRPEESELARRRPGGEAATLAARWAAKEACLKALGQHAAGVGWREIEVVRCPDGAPELRLHGAAEAALARAGGHRTLVSLSHEREYALAVVILL